MGSTGNVFTSSSKFLIPSLRKDTLYTTSIIFVISGLAWRSVSRGAIFSSDPFVDAFGLGREDLGCLRAVARSIDGSKFCLFFYVLLMLIFSL